MPNRITTSGFEYDAANRIHIVKQDGTTPTDIQAFQYGSTNARLMDYDYNTNLLKIFASVGGTTLAEYTEFAAATPTWTKSYTLLGDRLISSVTPDGLGNEYVEFQHPDRLGTRIQTVQAIGGVYEKSSLPYGTALSAESSLASVGRWFTSYDRSGITGLDYAVNRTYDSKQGRFTQVDPIGMKAVNIEVPQTLNLYNYCANDPINHVDPDGLFFKWLGRLFSKVGKAIMRIFSNIAVQIAVTVLAAIVTLGMSLAASLAVLMPHLTIPTWLVVASYISTGIGWAMKIGSALELTGLLFQGKFKELGKTIGVAFVGALVAVVEDAMTQGIYRALKNGDNIFVGAWRGLKRGIGFVVSSFKRFATPKWWEGFMPLYGYYCSPGWGIDGSTNGQSPVDGRDAACQRHDSDLANRDMDILNQIPVRTKTYYDLGIIKRSLLATSRVRLSDFAFGNGGRIGDRFGFTVPFAFGIRIAANRGQ